MGHHSEKAEVFLINTEYNEVVFYIYKNDVYIVEELESFVNKFKSQIIFGNSTSIVENYLQKQQNLRFYQEKDLYDFYIDRKQFTYEEVKQMFPREAKKREENNKVAKSLMKNRS